MNKTIEYEGSIQNNPGLPRSFSRVQPRRLKRMRRLARGKGMDESVLMNKDWRKMKHSIV